MFSKFNGGINNIFPNETIDLLTVSHLVKNNPEKDQIIEIRNIRAKHPGAKGKGLVKSRKKKLSNLTVSGIVKIRSLSGPGEFESNFISPSGYIFFDIDKDDVSKTPDFKRKFIEKYGDKASFVCYSSSMGGISVFIKYSGIVFRNISEFETLRQYIIETHFAEIKDEIDPSTEGVGQTWYISVDENPHENYKSIIKIPPDLFYNNSSNAQVEEPNKTKRSKNQYNRLEGDNITLNFTNLPSIKEVLLKMIWCTEVQIDKEVVDIKEIDFVKIHIPPFIPDGKKRKIFTSIFANFIKLNPKLPIEYAITLLNYINYNNTGAEPMSRENFKKFINGLITSYKSEKLYSVGKKKCVHFHKNTPVSKDQKNTIANKLNGKIRINKSIQKIINAKKELEKDGIQVTKAEVIKLTGLSKPSVYKYWDCNLINMDELLEKFNSKGFIN